MHSLTPRALTCEHCPKTTSHTAPGGGREGNTSEATGSTDKLTGLKMSAQINLSICEKCLMNEDRCGRNVLCNCFTALITKIVLKQRPRPQMQVQRTLTSESTEFKLFLHLGVSVSNHRCLKQRKDVDMLQDHQTQI